MTGWSLEKILSDLHDDIQNRLQIVRNSFGHPGTKGDASEEVWLKLFQTYLPERYRAEKAHVVDSKGQFSEQIDVVIFDRQYSPFIFNFERQLIVPAESVYAVFEAKQVINVDYVRYAQDKAKSVRRLHRTSLPIPHAGGTYDPKPPIPIIGGILTLESNWARTFDEPLRRCLDADKDAGRLNLGCIAAHGHFSFDDNSEDYIFFEVDKPATAFLFDLISHLQFSGTVPMIDIQAYAQWLGK